MDTTKTIAPFMAARFGVPRGVHQGNPLNLTPCSAPNSLAEISRFSTLENFSAEVRRRLVFVKARQHDARVPPTQ